MTIREEIGKRILFFDGGMGTLLQEQGLQAGELPETWNLKNPEPIIQILKAYLAAGADIILANTFGANRFKYGGDLEKIVTELEKGNLSLEDSLNKFEEGMKISKDCSKLLEDAEKRITIILEKNGEIKEENFTAEE